MTWEEIVELLISFGEKVHVIRGEGLDAVSLQLVPVAWFVSLKSSGQLNIGVYEGDDNRLLGTHSIPFAELRGEWLRDTVQRALQKQLVAMLDSDAMRDWLSASQRRPRF